MTVPKRLLLTGASGFIGRWTVSALGEFGWDVYPTSRSGLAGTRLLDLVGDADDVNDKVRAADATAIVHLAATGVTGPRTTLEPLVNTNVRGTAALLDAAATCHVERFVHVTTVLAKDPQDAYGISKAAAEILVTRVAHLGRIRATNLRLPVVFGPGEPPSKLLPYLIRFAMAGESAPLHTPDRVRSYVHVRDAAHAIAAALELQTPWESSYEVPGCARLSVADLAKLVAAVVRGERFAPPVYEPAPPQALPGWYPRNDLVLGIREVWAEILEGEQRR